MGEPGRRDQPTGAPASAPPWPCSCGASDYSAASCTSHACPRLERRPAACPARSFAVLLQRPVRVRPAAPDVDAVVPAPELDHALAHELGDDLLDLWHAELGAEVHVHLEAGGAVHPDLHDEA